MRKFILWLALIAVVFLLTRVVVQKNNISTPREEKIFEIKENTEDSITVSAKPIKLSSKENVVFEISLNTHSVELNYNLKELAVLIDEKGREYKPVSWDGEVGGHHLSGNLTFPSLGKNTKSFQLKIRNIAGIERIFSWNL